MKRIVILPAMLMISACAGGSLRPTSSGNALVSSALDTLRHATRAFQILDSAVAAGYPANYNPHVRCPASSRKVYMPHPPATER